MTRRAIIIGNNTGYQAPNHLAGVTKDLTNYQTYLKSSHGGEWSNSELLVLHNKTRAEILQAISNCRADYSFVVFSGHGFINARTGRTNVCVADAYVSEDELNTPIRKQTLILDCCREVTEMNESRTLSGRSQYLEKGGYLNMSGSERKITNARGKFDTALLRSGQGLCKAYACETGQTAADNSASGGIFSSALMRVGAEFGSNDHPKSDWLPIREAVQAAIAKISSNPLTNQKPTFVTVPGDLSPTHPFAITNLKYNTLL